MRLENLIIKKAKALEEYVIERRRDFHSFPEVKFEEVRSSKVIEEELLKLGFKVFKTAGTGVVGVMEGKGEGSVALRADMDALPIEEEGDLPYRSRVPGKMHACGHDAHMAMLLGAARIISELKDAFEGKVKLIFQPGEEGGGGAKRIVEEGHLDDVDAILGIHVWFELPSGVIATRRGALMASSDGFLIRIRGKGGHGATPHLTKDPTAPAADIYNALQKIVSRSLNPLSPVVLSVPVIEGSDAYNVIPDEVRMMGTLRTFDTKVRDEVMERMERIVRLYASAWECEGSLELSRIPYPPVVNSPDLAELVLRLGGMLGEIEEADMTMVSEDFAFYLEKVNGVFAFLGIRNEEKGIIYPHHSPKFNIDESVLWKGVALYALFAYSYLRSGR